MTSRDPVAAVAQSAAACVEPLCANVTIASVRLALLGLQIASQCQ